VTLSRTATRTEGPGMWHKRWRLAFAPERGAPLHALVDHEWGLTRGPGDERLWLAACLVIALAARMTVATLFPNVYHPDEHFQYWEQAYRLAFGDGIMPWEYRVGIRSWILPGMIAGIMSAVDALGGGAAVWRALVQLLLSLASLSIVVTAFFWGKRLSGTGAAILAAFVSATWFETVYFSAKPLTEVIAASLLFPAAYLLCVRENPSLGARISAGLMLGLAFTLRFHVAPAILVIGIASMLNSPWPRWLPQLLAAGLVVLASGLLDWMTWDYPFQSVWMNFYVNVVEDRASSFGTSPIFWFLLLYANAWPGFVVPMLACLAFGIRRSPLLFLVPVALVLSHSLIGHKEYRFVYPVLPFLLTLACVGAVEIYAFATRGFSIPARRTGFFALAGAWLLTSFTLAAHDGFRGNFVKTADVMGAFDIAHDYAPACGLGVADYHWAGTPGYTGLRRDIPIYLLPDQLEGARLRQAYNVLVYRETMWPPLSDTYLPLGCSTKGCVAVREGTCTPMPGETVNRSLERRGE